MSWIKDPKKSIDEEKRASQAEEAQWKALVQEWDAVTRSLLSDVGKFLWGNPLRGGHYLTSDLKKAEWTVGQGLRPRVVAGEETRLSPRVKVDIKSTFVRLSEGVYRRQETYFHIEAHYGRHTYYGPKVRLSKQDLQAVLQQVIDWMSRQTGSWKD